VALAWKLGDKGQVLATDSSAERRKKLAENLGRTGLKQVMVYDGEIPKMPPAQKFDLIWVDAPCSGTGVLSRRADLRWKLTPGDITAHPPEQQAILEEVQGHLYPKGHLVYSTCSLEEEENQKVVEDFLAKHPGWSIAVPILPGNFPSAIKDEFGITFLPTSDHDGGFLSLLVKG
jgi:16S rRNA (cytosine967-C5)-methyltransferase